MSSDVDLLEAQIENLREALAGFRAMRFTIEHHGDAENMQRWLELHQRTMEELDQHLRKLETERAERGARTKHN